VDKSGGSLSDGLLLPFRVFFQPRKTIIRSVMLEDRQAALTVFCYSLLWVVAAYLAGIVVLASSIGRVPPDALSPLIPALLAFLGGLLGFNGMRVVEMNKSIFNFGIACAFGVYFNVAALISFVILNQIAHQEGLDVAHVVDSPTLDQPIMGVLGAGIALALAGVLYGLAAPRTSLAVAFIFSIFFIVVMALGPNPAVRTANLIAFGTAGLLMTHLVFQPFYLLIAALSAILVEIDPEASRWLWAISPARWCEISYIPLLGLSGLVTSLHRLDRDAGLRAAVELAQHPFYDRVGARLVETFNET
jgi:hypothetical protein